MPINKFRSVAVVVSNDKKAKEWYTDKLDFEVQDDIEGWIVVGPPGSSSGIHLCSAFPVEPNRSARARNTGILFFADDIEGTCQELKQRGVEFTKELEVAEWDKSVKYAMFRDLDGNEFWLMNKYGLW
ncbi:MAG: VOC family protein [Candidatus Bathyarchaeota archaeon]|nr:VOC family protein [Candidatus Bathyarchaeota archaeon]